MSSSSRRTRPSLACRSSRDVPAVRAALGQEGIVEGVDYRGVPVLAAVRRARFAVVSGGPHGCRGGVRADAGALWLIVILMRPCSSGGRGRGLDLAARSGPVYFREVRGNGSAAGERGAVPHPFREFPGRHHDLGASFLEVHFRKPGHGGDVQGEERAGIHSSGPGNCRPSGSRTDAPPPRRPRR